MKPFTTLLAAFSILAAVPVHAADKKDDKAKKEDKGKKDDKKDDKKDEKKDWEKETLYTATISTTTGEAKESDMSEVKSLLMTSSAFKCKDVKLEDKSVVATLSVGKDKGRLSKSDVNRILKDKPVYKVDKLDEVKPEKEKKEDKKADKKDEKKDEKK